MAVLLGVCNWVHPLLQSPSCCKELKEAGLDAIQLDLGSAEEDFPLSSPGIQRQWKEEAELYGIRLDAVAVLAVLKHGMTAEPGSERRNTAEKAIAAAVDCAADMGIPGLCCRASRRRLSVTRTICVRRPAVCGWPARWRNTGALL
ncbi:MAG: hypothetical protein ACLR0N_02245 [Bilophila wadsworthia]